MCHHCILPVTVLIALLHKVVLWACDWGFCAAWVVPAHFSSLFSWLLDSACERTKYTTASSSSSLLGGCVTYYSSGHFCYFYLFLHDSNIEIRSLSKSLRHTSCTTLLVLHTIKHAFLGRCDSKTHLCISHLGQSNNTWQFSMWGWLCLLQ